MSENLGWKPTVNRLSSRLQSVDENHKIVFLNEGLISSLLLQIQLTARIKRPASTKFFGCHAALKWNEHVFFKGAVWMWNVQLRLKIKVFCEIYEANLVYILPTCANYTIFNCNRLFRLGLWKLRWNPRTRFWYIASRFYLTTPCQDPGDPYQGNRIGQDFRHGQTVRFTLERE